MELSQKKSLCGQVCPLPLQEHSCCTVTGLAGWADLLEDMQVLKDTSQLLILFGQISGWESGREAFLDFAHVWWKTWLSLVSTNQFSVWLKCASFLNFFFKWL